MSGIEPRKPRGRVPLGLLGMLVLLAVCETAFRALEQPLFTTNAAMSWRFGGHAARTRVRECDLLFLGDSQVQFALLPRVFEQRTGLRAYNLALHAAPPAATYFQLVAALESGAKPRALVVDFPPHALKMRPEGQARLWSELLSLRDTIDLAWTARDPTLFAKIVLGRWLPSIRDRFEIREALLGALRGQDGARSARFWLTPLWRNWDVNLGANIFPPNPQPSTDLARHSWLAPSSWLRRRVSMTYMRRFLDLAQARGITVYWLLPPVHPVVRAERQRRNLEGSFTQFVQEVQSRYPNLVVLDARDCGYGAEVFSDLAHLDRRGASVLSVDVADVLRHRQGPPGTGPSWFRLPGYRPLPFDVPVEDIAQSRIALRISR